MINRIPKSLWILLSFAVATVLYWPSLHGKPLWDDFSFLFHYEVVTGHTPNFTILRDFSWPIGVLIHKYAYALWKTDYFPYHLLNLFIHFLNSYLLLKIARGAKLPFAFALFLLFLFHPSNVISVSWIIQLKTLICFTFAILSFYFLTKTHENKKWFFPSWLCFLFSILSKSASLPLTVVFFIYYYSRSTRKELLWIVPFFFLSIYGAYRVVMSPVTISATENLNREKAPQETAQVTTTPEFVAPIYTPTPVGDGSEEAIIAAGLASLKASAIEPQSTLKFIEVTRYSLILGSIHYYFWQSLLPIDNAPIKGLKHTPAGWFDFIHLAFLALMTFLLWRKKAFFVLVCGYIMLTPFLGFIAAPYMNLTWVSDQHLYLALPFFLVFWLFLIEELKMKKKEWLFILPLMLFSYSLYQATPYYKNEITFYEASLASDAYNVPVAYNLAVAHIIDGHPETAFEITESIISLGNVSPEVSQNQYFPYMFYLNRDLQAYKGYK